jgi:hypothetical protein
LSLWGDDGVPAVQLLCVAAQTPLTAPPPPPLPLFNSLHTARVPPLIPSQFQYQYVLSLWGEDEVPAVQLLCVAAQTPLTAPPPPPLPLFNSLHTARVPPLIPSQFQYQYVLSLWGEDEVPAVQLLCVAAQTPLTAPPPLPQLLVPGIITPQFVVQVVLRQVFAAVQAPLGTHAPTAVQDSLVGPVKFPLVHRYSADPENPDLVLVTVFVCPEVSVSLTVAPQLVSHVTGPLYVQLAAGFTVMVTLRVVLESAAEF